VVEPARIHFSELHNSGCVHSDTFVMRRTDGFAETTGSDVHRERVRKFAAAVGAIRRNELRRSCARKQSRQLVGAEGFVAQVRRVPREEAEPNVIRPSSSAVHQSS